MAAKTNIIKVNINITKEVAEVLARATILPVYDQKSAGIKLRRLEEAGINEESLTQYFMQVATLVEAWHAAKRSIAENVTLKKYKFAFGELRQLYLPALFATVVSQVGDVKIGSYDIQITPRREGVVDREFIIRMSEALYENDAIIFAERDQIGVANREGNASVMSTIVLVLDHVTRDAEVATQTGQAVDDKAKLLSTLAGIELVNKAHTVLYPNVDYVNYGNPGSVFVSNANRDI